MKKILSYEKGEIVVFNQHFNDGNKAYAREILSQNSFPSQAPYSVISSKWNLGHSLGQGSKLGLDIWTWREF